ncbi:MAG: hypothetical protein IKB88_05345 [Clostridia bacterium]|nr:hypothetical protein [Clostridia bacterium]
MKKILVLIPLFLFLSACSVQENVSPDLFVSRLEKTVRDAAIDSDGIFYENEKSVVYADYGGCRFAIEMTCDSDGKVKKISLACNDTDKAECFYSFIKNIVSVYAPDEDCDRILQNLCCGKQFSFYESQWYSYSFSSAVSGFYFGVENKKLAPAKDIGLTLKPNDIVTRAN